MQPKYDYLIQALMPLVYPSLASLWHDSNALFEVGNLARTYSRHQRGSIHTVKVNQTSIPMPNMEEYMLKSLEQCLNVRADILI